MMTANRDQPFSAAAVSGPMNQRQILASLRQLFRDRVCFRQTQAAVAGVTALASRRCLRQSEPVRRRPTIGGSAPQLWRGLDVNFAEALAGVLLADAAALSFRAADGERPVQRLNA